MNAPTAIDPRIKNLRSFPSFNHIRKVARSKLAIDLAHCSTYCFLACKPFCHFLSEVFPVSLSALFPKYCLPTTFSLNDSSSASLLFYRSHACPGSPSFNNQYFGLLLGVSQAPQPPRSPPLTPSPHLQSPPPNPLALLGLLVGSSPFPASCNALLFPLSAP